MAIALYEHNETAYKAAMKLLSEKGKAAVIHPTGTGKSFIAFKLCEDHPDKKICWLSPSAYIFKTQVENLKASLIKEKQKLYGKECDRSQTGDDKEDLSPVTDNISFYTYAKLMSMPDSEIRAMDADYIILDEFHRCGAKMWGEGVDTLLSSHRDVPVLGLSATAVRHLDHCRNMADELFEGNIASEMSLGEAIVRGILYPPRYILSIYSRRQELDKYEKRVRKARNAAVRQNAEKYLEELKRALENAEGLDLVFEKHMTVKDGKYIVFCTDYEHLKEMSGKVPEWFGRVDSSPHVYIAYSDDPATSRQFQEFKADQSEHLKLLFCIDMLNEGIHLDDIQGVILLRPTVSPIVFKQQIGRAFSAGKQKEAVIFDIVLNIENLYSIDTLQEEMDLATAWYRSTGEESKILNEHFEITCEAEDCLRLFSQLNESLTASWNYMFSEAEKYYKENRDLNVPKRYITPSGFSLGSWLSTQRQIHAGKIPGRLTEDQVSRLDSIGMCWLSRTDLSWDKYYRAAEKYRQEHGHLLVKYRESYDGVRLGAWIKSMRTYKKSGIQKNYLTPDRIRQLDQLGMVWDIPDYIWEQNYHAAIRYHQIYGDLNVRPDYIDSEGIHLGLWLNRVRNVKNAPEKYKDQPLTKEQIRALDALGMTWGSRHDEKWNRAYRAVCLYRDRYGNLEIPVSYVSEDEDHLRLGRWIRLQRDNWKKGRLSGERQEKLKKIGMVCS